MNAHKNARIPAHGLRSEEAGPESNRYEPENPGDLLHLNIKNLARFRRLGYRTTVTSEKDTSRGAGSDLSL